MHAGRYTLTNEIREKLDPNVFHINNLNYIIEVRKLTT